MSHSAAWRPESALRRPGGTGSRLVVLGVRSTAPNARCIRASAQKDPREELSQVQLKEYDACLDFVSTFGLGSDEAENVVKESFGWAGRKYWRKQRVSHATHDCI